MCKRKNNNTELSTYIFECYIYVCNVVIIYNIATHFMDEADVLSDRIAIMASGEIKCCGSSLYLKQLYGVGYSITVSLENTSNVDKIHEMIKKHINTSELLSEHANELIYRLPFNMTKQFPELFNDIDSHKQELNITNYGVSATTLEHVFLKVADDEMDLNKGTISSNATTNNNSNNNDENDVKRDEDAVNNLDTSDLNSDDFNKMLEDIRIRSEKNLFFVHIYAILYKKYHSIKRDKRTLMCQVFLPIMFMLLGFATAGIETTPYFDKLSLDMSQFSKFDGVYNPYNSGSDSNIFSDNSIFNDISGISMQGITTTNTDNTPYQYNSNTDTYLDDYKQRLLDISGSKPFKFISYYFPINSDGNVTANNIGCGYNTSAKHGLPISVNIGSNIAIKTIKSTASITTSIESFPSTTSESAVSDAIQGFIYAANINFALSFFSCSIVYNTVLEKELSVKHQQLVSGMNSISYWIGTYIFDLISYIPLLLFSLILVLAFDADAFKGDKLGPFVLSLFLYGLCIMPVCYLFSWLSKTSTKAQYISLFIFIATGYILGIVTYILDALDTAESFVTGIMYILNLLPTYATMTLIPKYIIHCILK